MGSALVIDLLHVTSSARSRYMDAALIIIVNNCVSSHFLVAFYLNNIV